MILVTNGYYKNTRRVEPQTSPGKLNVFHSYVANEAIAGLCELSIRRLVTREQKGVHNFYCDQNYINQYTIPIYDILCHKTNSLVHTENADITDLV